MRRTRLIVLIILGLGLLLVSIHFTINGFPSLSSLNPHAR
jgi:hypothetical protein